MKNRVISGIIMAIIIIPVLIIGGYLFNLAMLLLSAGAYVELIGLDKKKELPNSMKIIGFVCVAVISFLGLKTGSLEILGLNYSLLAGLFLLLLIPTIFLGKKGYGTKEAFVLIFEVLFLGIVFSIFINLFTENKLVFIYLLLISTMTDIFALFGGKLVGKHKFTKISPNKTIEGCVIGAVFATIVGTFYYTTLFNYNNILLVILMTVVLSLIGQVGDLFFSLIKRENDIKDFSNLIPGHGGLLDRLDNLTFVMLAFTILMRVI